MKRDMLSVLLVVIGALLCGTVPGLFIGAPMATFGAYVMVEPRLGDSPDFLNHIAGQTR
ncbi:hypothetical protein [Haladaptatus sp. CMAA 1911]|uniref:hypothetical protein n=1 Tax=unclassified Haladaptatus TaxID=2622732 RepID=UPI0037552CD4